MAFTLAWVLQCVAMTLMAKSPSGLMHGNECGIKSDMLISHFSMKK